MSRSTMNKLGVVTAAAAALIAVAPMAPSAVAAPMAPSAVAAPMAPSAVAAPTDVRPMGLNGPFRTEESCNAAREEHPQFPHVGECQWTSFGPGAGWWWGFYS